MKVQAIKCFDFLLTVVLLAPLAGLLSWLALCIGATPALAAMDDTTLAIGLKNHDRALHIKDGWIHKK